MDNTHVARGISQLPRSYVKSIASFVQILIFNLLPINVISRVKHYIGYYVTLLYTNIPKYWIFWPLQVAQFNGSHQSYHNNTTAFRNNIQQYFINKFRLFYVKCAHNPVRPFHLPKLVHFIQYTNKNECIKLRDNVCVRVGCRYESFWPVFLFFFIHLLNIDEVPMGRYTNLIEKERERGWEIEKENSKKISKENQSSWIEKLIIIITYIFFNKVKLMLAYGPYYHFFLLLLFPLPLIPAISPLYNQMQINTSLSFIYA